MLTRSLMTAEDFEKVAESVGSCELIRGEVVTFSPEGFRHSSITESSAFILGQWARCTKLGRVLSGEPGFVVATDPDTVRGADVAYISFARMPKQINPVGFCKQPPELVVEVLGEGQGWPEVLEKVAQYLHMGVDRVWVLDPGTQQLNVFRKDAPPVVYSSEPWIEDAEILPDFRVRVSEFFE
ncbi:MAG: Uma2 family endonuclease [Phycisphaerales bacterium]|nr:Uma2 family endonuclease [Phycisphaerales bacterium]